MSNFRRDIFKLSESHYSDNAPEVDGKYVIGKVSGESFVPDGYSRNKRFYSRDLWEKVIANEGVQTRLQDRNMFGTIGHDTKLDDDAFRKGEFTHIVSDIRISEDGKGVADYLILNTEAGRNLNTILRAGSKIYVSSRADGTFVEGKSKDGMPIVDPDNYHLETFDFVLDPGFLQASPSLKEAYNNLFPNESEDNMSESLVKALNDKNDELISVNGKLSEAIRSNQALESKTKSLEAENEVLSSTNDSMREELSAAKVALEKFGKIGTAEEIEVITESLGDVVSAISDYDSEVPVGEQVEKLSVIATESHKALSLLAEADLADEGDTLYSAVVKVISVFDHVDEAIEILEANDLKDKSESLKTVAEKMVKVTAIVENTTKMAEESERKARISALATELNVSEDKIELVAEKSDEEIRKIYGSVKEVIETHKKFSHFQKPIEESTDDSKNEGTTDFSRISSVSAQLGAKFGFGA